MNELYEAYSVSRSLENLRLLEVNQQKTYKIVIYLYFVYKIYSKVLLS